MKIEKKHKGGRNELIACAWLLNQGYEVFRNVCDCGEIDVIGLKDGKITFFDVKSAQLRKDGTLSPTRLSQDQVDRDVKALYITPQETCIIDWAPIGLHASRAGFICEGCSSEFNAVKTFQRFCSRACRLAHMERQRGLNARDILATQSAWEEKEIPQGVDFCSTSQTSGDRP
jgi:Holliday junction resolvase-like predicted endonuclease